MSPTTPRRFASIAAAPEAGHPMTYTPALVLYATATDGTAWVLYPRKADWIQMPNLPQEQQ